MDPKRRAYLLGELAAKIETIANMPSRVISNISIAPIEMLKYWLPKALKKDDSHVISDVLNQIDEIPSMFVTADERANFWVGYLRHSHI